MMNATREKTRLWLLIFVGVVATLLGQTHAREIFTPSPPESGIFAEQTQASTGQNYDACQYDTLDSLLAANGGAKINVAALDFSTGANKAVFYSGPGNHARAMSFAERSGATPIDLTSGGQYLNSLKLYDTMPAAQADAIWAQASQAYATGAQGRINLFVNGARQDRVFHTIEAPIIKANSSIYKQTFHY